MSIFTEKGFCGYCFRFCKVCKKETFHFIFEGVGCRAYLCRNYKHHRGVE